MAAFIEVKVLSSVLFFLFLGTFINFAYGAEVCPLAEDMKPCACRQECSYCPQQIRCKQIDNVESLNNVVERTRSYPFKDFLLENTCILYIPAEAVEKKKMERLYIRGGCLSSIFERPPVTNRLRHFYMQNVRLLRGIQWSLLSNTTLKTIAIREVAVRRLSRNFGEKLPKTLTLINFEKTQTYQIARNAFVGLVNLQSLTLTSTYIKQLSRDMFPIPWNIGVLFFTHNQIETLPDDIFTQMPKLQGISLNNNNITTIKQAVFGDVYPRLSLLNFNNNPIACDCAVKWLASKEKKPYIYSGKCSKPKELEGKELKNLKSGDFRRC